MRMPGFTADVAVGKTRGHYRLACAPGGPGARDAVTAQLTGRVFGRPGGRFGTIADYWPCRDECARARSACFETCEGTWENPKGSTNCTLCNDDYNRCMQGCTRDIA